MGNGASDPLATCCGANTNNLELNDNRDVKPRKAQEQMPEVNLPHLIKIQSRVKGWIQRIKFDE